MLLDFLQEAYRAKAQPKSTGLSTDSSVSHIVLPTSTIPTTISTSTIAIEVEVEEEATAPSFVRDTTEPEHVIRAENIQLEKIFPEISTASTSITETTETTPFVTTTTVIASTSTIESNETTATSNVPSTTTTIVTSTETTVLSTTVTEEDSTTTESTTTLESTTVTEMNTTESVTTTAMMNNVTNATDFERLITNVTASLTDEPSTTFESTTAVTSTETESTQTTSAEMSTSTSILTTESPVPVEDLLHALNKSESLRNRLLYKLCRQLLSQMFPNATLSSVNSTESVMTLASNSSLMMNQTANALLSWIQEQLNSTSSTPLTTTTTSIPTSTTTIIETSTPVVPSPLVQGRKLESASSLQRIDMDEALGWANDPIDGEH